MSSINIIQKLKRYQSSSEGSKMRRDYMRGFEVKMIYRTTKTENPSATKKMVEGVLDRLR